MTPLRDMQPEFLSVEQCRASLPIRISRRKLVEYIRTAGQDYYQEHRRQLFLTPQQWQVVAAGIKPCSKSSGGGRRAPFKSSVHSPESAYAKAQALFPSRTRRPSASSLSGSSLTKAPSESVEQPRSQRLPSSTTKKDDTASS